MSSSKTKKDKRKQRRERNRELQRISQEEAWNSGRVILENNNGQEYSPEYSVKLVKRLCEILGANPSVEAIRSFKKDMISAVLYYNSGILKVPEYEFIKTTLENYWDGKY